MTVLALLLLPALCAGSSWPGSVIHSDDGPIQGSYDILTGVTSFHGVPFAAAPTGDLRWKAPERPTPWTKTRKTTSPVHQCPQFDLIKGIRLGEEDCLYMSIYVPKGCTAANPCPVMQWIYGGAWIIGSNREFGVYDGANFAKKNGVIIVAGNYRLDTFGWLALDELELESADGSYGNYGLKDQRAAMQWTQRNIHLFGGDSDKVTIYGESAGGWSVCQHLVSPGSNQLFSHAIVESGDCDGPWMVRPQHPHRDYLSSPTAGNAGSSIHHISPHTLSPPLERRRAVGHDHSSTVEPRKHFKSIAQLTRAHN